jgi:hypothetical protein
LQSQRIAFLGGLLMSAVLGMGLLFVEKKYMRQQHKGNQAQQHQSH